MPRAFWLAILGVVLAPWAIGPVPSIAQSSVNPPRGPAYEFRQITNDVYTAMETGAMNVGANTPIIITDDEVLIVDSHITPASARALLEELRQITDKPVRYVINTHYHFDHAHGNQVFGPEVTIIGHEFTRRMLLSDVLQQRTYQFFTAGVPQEIDELKRRAADEPDPAERRRLEDQAYVQEAYLGDLDEVRPTPPNVTLRTALSLFRGDREIQLLFFGRGHTGGDVVVYLPEERILCTGDLVGPGLSYMGDGHVSEWADTLGALLALDFETVLPGHGEPFTGREPIRNLRAYLEDLWTQVSGFHAQGVSVQQAAERVDMTGHRDAYPSIQGVGIAEGTVRRIYEVIEGVEIPR